MLAAGGIFLQFAVVVLLTDDVTAQCDVTDSAVNCTNMGFTDTSYLRRLPDKYETITYVGNFLGAIDDSLFGNRVMRRLKYLDLSNNGIEYIGMDAFNSTTELTTLILRQNRWRTNSSIVGIFSPLITLRYLDLRAAFLTTYQVSDNRDENATMYHVTHLRPLIGDAELLQLEILHLEDNGILSLPSTLFQNTPALKELWLSGNSIVDPEFNASLLQRLEEIHLDRNAIRYLSTDSIANMVIMNKSYSLRLVNISSNPFECVCYARLFIKYIQTNSSNSFVVDRDKLSCHYPRLQTLMSVQLLKLDETPCRRQADSVYRVSYVVVGLVLGSAVVAAICLVFNNRGKVAKKTNYRSVVDNRTRSQRSHSDSDSL